MREHLRNVEHAVLEALARRATIDADATLFLLQLARSEEREDLIEVIGGALAQALVDSHEARSVRSRAAWLTLFVEACHVSDDERLHEAVGRLTLQLRDAWTAAAVADAAAALGGACRAALLADFHTFAAPAIEALERMVATCYRPGRPLGTFADQVGAASALLSAYELSGRLPYPMLAEELMRGVCWDPAAAFDEACEAARVWCRLGALHADAGYRAAAVLAPGADYRADAARMLSDLATEADQRGAAAGIYGLALLELESASLLP